MPGYDDIASKILSLDHIADPNLRPLDDLLRDHFLQSILRNMRGPRKPVWDYEDALSSMIDLSRLDLWEGEGKAHLEFEMANRLHSFRVEQEIDT